MYQQGQVLNSKASGVLPSEYHPELDLTPYCDDETANYYQQQIINDNGHNNTPTPTKQQ